jgi:lysophospholipase L1-like esterase
VTRPIRYLALGDSYTIGTSVGPKETYVHQLADRLRKSYSIEVADPCIVARNGWRTDNLANALDSAEPRSDYDLVFLLIGVNDLYQGFSLEGYRTRFTSLIERAIGYADGQTNRVLAIAIPDYAYTPKGEGSEEISIKIDAFNDAAREVTDKFGIPLFNVTAISREGLDSPELVAEDKLHPSGRQYGRWVDEVLLESVAERIRATD